VGPVHGERVREGVGPGRAGYLVIAAGVFVATQLTLSTWVLEASFCASRLQGIWVIIVGAGLLAVGLSSARPALVGWTVRLSGPASRSRSSRSSSGVPVGGFVASRATRRRSRRVAEHVGPEQVPASSAASGSRRLEGRADTTGVLMILEDQAEAEAIAAELGRRGQTVEVRSWKDATDRRPTNLSRAS